MRNIPGRRNSLRGKGNDVGQHQKMIGKGNNSGGKDKDVGQHQKMIGKGNNSGGKDKDVGQHQKMIGKGNNSGGKDKDVRQHQKVIGKGNNSRGKDKDAGQHQKVIGKGNNSRGKDKDVGQHQKMIGKGNNSGCKDKDIGQQQNMTDKGNSLRDRGNKIKQQQKTVGRGDVSKEASGTRERRRTRSLPEDQVQHSPTTKVKNDVSKQSPVHTQPNLTGRQSKVGGSKVGCRKEPIKPSPVKKSRQSVTSQLDFKNIGNAKCVVGPSSHSPRKRRLRSFERQCNSVSSMQEDGAKSSPAKKLRRSTDKKSAASLPLETGESPVSKGKDAARHRQEKGMKSTETLIKATSENKEQIHVVGTVGKISGKRKLASISKAPKDETAQMQETETVKSTPEGLYDFVVDSPIPDDNNSDSVKGGTNSKPLSKSSKSSTSVGSKRSKVAGKKTRLRKEIDPSLITPKTRRCRVVLKPLNENKTVSKKIKVKVDIHSGIPVQPDSSQKNKSDGCGKAKQKAQKVNKGKTRKVRPDSSSFSDLPIPKMPSTSFLDTEIFSEPYNDDSAIFLSPTAIKTRKPKANSKLQTPLSGMLTDKRISGVDCSFNVNNIKSTSTPNPEPKNDIGIDLVREQVLSQEPKLSQPEFLPCSPVKQVETPADSDYGSMESFVTPSPLKDQERGHALSPAFSLEEDTETLALNKSIEKSYKRTKKKFQKGRYSVAKVDEWAEKVNSEIEDIENFELSVEG